VNPKSSLQLSTRALKDCCNKCKKKLFARYLEGLDPTNVYEEVGCKECNFTGYKGRTGIYEAILTDQKVEEIVKENPSEREINKASENQGILTMKQDGIIKILQGVTSFDELRRVIDLEE
jgi:type IV pilus assembly protein PilB